MAIYSILCNKCYNFFCNLEIHLQVHIKSGYMRK